MTEYVVALLPGDSLTVSVPAPQPIEGDGTAQPADAQPAAPADAAPDAAPDGTPTDLTAEPDGSPDQGGVTETDNAPSGVGAG